MNNTTNISGVPARKPRPARPSAARLWADLEDHGVPRLALQPMERVLYFFLLRKSHLTGRSEFQCSITRLARALHVHAMTVRLTLRRLRGKDVVRILDRGRDGLRMQVRAPRQIRGCVPEKSSPPREHGSAPDHYRVPVLRMAIYRRDAHRCFYCRRALHARNRVLDHVVPRTRGGQGSPDNLVACCLECSSLKCNRSADFLLELLRRTGRLTARRLEARRRALARLRRTAKSGAPRCPEFFEGPFGV